MLGTGRPSEQDFNPGGLSEGGVIAFAFWRDYSPPPKKNTKNCIKHRPGGWGDCVVCIQVRCEVGLD